MLDAITLAGLWSPNHDAGWTYTNRPGPCRVLLLPTRANGEGEWCSGSAATSSTLTKRHCRARCRPTDG